ncbi:MAG: hypothetical protein AB7I38_17195 [Dehalococcoidia bacterium]
MTPLQGWSLVALGAVLMIAGSAMIRAAGRKSQLRKRSTRPIAGVLKGLTCTALGCAVITGTQWAILSRTGSGAVWVGVLALPGFLAAATVTRLLSLWRTVHLLRRRAVEQSHGGDEQ